jgi:hypothetical protein
MIEVEIGGLREVLIGGRQMFGIGKINTFLCVQMCNLSDTVFPGRSNQLMILYCRILYFLEEAINL